MSIRAVDLDSKRLFERAPELFLVLRPDQDFTVARKASTIPGSSSLT
jgi:hypothetical protein